MVFETRKSNLEVIVAAPQIDELVAGLSTTALNTIVEFPVAEVTNSSTHGDNGDGWASGWWKP